MRIENSKEITLYVNDLEVAVSFYTNIVGLMVAERVKDQYSRLKYDDGTVILFQTQITPIENEDSTSEPFKLGQVSFGTSSSDLSSWRSHLQKHDISIEEEFTWPNGSQSIYFRDPAGNRIELKTQEQRSQKLAQEVPSQQEVSPGGLNAKWKLYHAVNLGDK